MRNVIVIGAGRQGTTYLSQVLSACGYDVGHERVGEDGIVSLLCTAETNKRIHGDTYFDAMSKYKDPVFLHLIRDPRKAIPSMTTIDDVTWQWICDIPFSNMNMSDSLLLKSMKYYHYWNKEAHRKAEYSFTLEKVRECWKTITHLLEIDCEFPDDTLFRRNERTHIEIEESAYMSHPLLWQNINKLYRKIDIQCVR